ncbi:MAG: PAS domain S-box protein [Burkholderiales bacterium]|nr:PAS domain S-box protein [Burkholderiales bacterium]
MPPDLPQATLRVLLVEDDADDAELVRAELEDQLGACALHQVETRRDFEEALSGCGWDVIVSDVHLPGFSALEALYARDASGRDLPLVLLSGYIGEEAAAALIKAGAADFVAKSNLRSLPGVINRCLREAQVLRERAAAQAALAASEARYRGLVEMLPVAMLMVDRNGMIVLANAEAERLFDWPRAELVGRAARTLVPPELRDCLPPLWRAIHRDASTLRLGTGKTLMALRRDGALVPIEIALSPVDTADGPMALASVVDVSLRKRAEAEILSSREQLRELTAHLNRAKEEERAVIAREIHDELGGLLTGARIEVANMARELPPQRLDLVTAAGSVEALLDQALDITRRISRQLRPAILDYGIVAALDWQARDFSKRTGIGCQLDTDTEDVELEPERATAVFRIAQEALTNVARHAGASRVRFEFATGPGNAFTLRIADDGSGITGEDIAKSGSFGIRSMRERAQFLGGELAIGAAPGGGTEVELRVAAQRGGIAPALAGELWS